MLLEQMDLTPRKSAQLAAARSQSRAESRAGLHDDLTHDSVAEAVVPLSLYEDQVADYDKLRLQLQELEKQNAELRRAQEARKARASEVRSNEAILEAERVKMRAEARDRQAEMEEERRLERADELRRRKEIEERERELRDKMSKKDDDHQRYQQEAESRQKSLQVKLEASEQLVKEMKDRIEHESARGESQETLQTQLQLKDAEIDSLKSSLRRLEEEAQASRDALSRQIDELKDAGRETISLYEQRIEEIDSERIEVLENMQLLQDKAQEAIRAAETRVEELQAALSSQQSRGGSLEAGSAAAIDNAALREQVAHLQDKLGKYEDQISEAALNLEKEKEYAQKRRDKSHEVETSLKNELKRMRVEAERAQRASKEQLAQLEETRHALQESQHALERERAELEGLRLDAENFNALKSGPESLAASGAAAAEWRSEMAKLEAELARQKEDKAAELGARDDEIRRLRMQLEKAGPTAGEAERSPRSPDANRLSTASIGSTSSYLKSSNRMSSNGAYAASEASAASSANQMSGLSYLVRQLSDENNDMKTKHRLLESELKARVQEAETKSRTLELTVESLRQQLDARQDGQDGVADTSMLAEKLATSEARLQSSETTLADLRSTLEATKMERKETADSLQKEVSQLESLVEARIFREEELMAEVERLSRKLDERSPARRFSKLEPEATKAAEPVRAEAAKAPVATGSSSRDAPAPSTAIPAQGEAEPCDDCGEVGHRFEDCPYAAEIF
jgi:peptidoglycan hydrolase CwlO-like protein